MPATLPTVAGCTASGDLELLRYDTARLAYEKWRQEGQSHGHDLSHWLAAETEVLSLHGTSPPIVQRLRRQHNVEDLQLVLEELERRLKLLHAISSLLAVSASVVDLVPPLLETVCSVCEWDVGLFWRVEEHADYLCSEAEWSVPAEALKGFCRASSQMQIEPGVGLPGRVWIERRSVWIDELKSEPGLLRQAEVLQGRLNSAYAFPVMVPERFVGVMEFYSGSNKKPTPGFLNTLESIGSQIAQFTIRRNAERVLLLQSHELALAKSIQQGWQHRESPTIAGYDIGGASMAAAEVGGDYFDFFSMPDGQTGIVIGDAAGHGLNSALNIAEVRAYVRALAAAESRLERILALTNQHFIHHTEEDVSFVTLLLVRLNPITGELTYNSAGHLSGYVFDATGRLKKKMPSTSFPLGIVSDAPFPAAPPLRLNPGDWVLMFTDGVIDACDERGESLGIDRFLQLAREVCPGRCARESVPILLDRIANFANREFDDDMTTVVIARNAGSNKQ